MHVRQVRFWAKVVGPLREEGGEAEGTDQQGRFHPRAGTEAQQE